MATFAAFAVVKFAGSLLPWRRLGPIVGPGSGEPRPGVVAAGCPPAVAGCPVAPTLCTRRRRSPGAGRSGCRRSTRPPRGRPRGPEQPTAGASAGFALRSRPRRWRLAPAEAARLRRCAGFGAMDRALRPEAVSPRGAQPPPARGARHPVFCRAKRRTRHDADRHARERNGLRSGAGNKMVLRLAAPRGLPCVSGSEPSANPNLTAARSIPGFIQDSRFPRTSVSPRA